VSGCHVSGCHVSGCHVSGCHVSDCRNRLSHVCLGRCSITHRSLRVLLQSVNTSALCVLDLSNNHLGDRGVLVLASVLPVRACATCMCRALCTCVCADRFSI
jgi:hypothetical protein